MKKIFFDAIRSGVKTTTLRYWRRPIIRAGSVHSVRGLGDVLVDDVQAISPEDLTDADVRADGFASRAELAAVLGEIYTPAQRRGRMLYKVSFTFLGPGHPSSAGTPRPPGRASASTAGE